ncbi:hypothetical protein [Pseudofrankia sp. DC12]|uniref:hypothetical protein n=1 Tax=Pseudofrankia sp. DC12 TaxID=683315 RepID=UPI000696BD6B|nr:hypothetical protein [Pseudofrankia sp. DC12]
MARHRVAPRSVPRAVPAGTGASARAHGRHAPTSATTTARLALSRRVVTRRIALPAASVAVASVVTVGGVAFASDGSGSTVPTQRVASTAPANHPSASTGVDGGVTASAVGMTGGTPAGTAATGAVAASPNDAAAIAAAIRHSDLTGQVPANAYQVVGAKLSRGDPTWAWARLIPVTDTIDQAQGVLHRTASGWQLVQLGSYEVGCSVAPAQVRADLALDCPPGAAG